MGVFQVKSPVRCLLPHSAPILCRIRPARGCLVAVVSASLSRREKMDRQYDLLEMIAPPKESWKIHVRVIRLWSLPKFKDPKSSSSIEMVLMDEQGTTMHASVGEDLISVFEPLISEGTVTTVLLSFCDAIPLYGIKLVPFRKIMGYSPHHSFLIGTNIVQNIMYGTKLLINPDIPETLMLRKREISQYLSVVSGKPAYLDEDEVLYSTWRKTIKKLRAAADVGFYVVRATVLDVEPVPSWWYKSCVCSVKAEANADEYFCDGCNRDVNNVVDRYKLNLLVFDGTDTINFVVFDKEVAALFGRTCTEMVKELNEKGKASKDPTGFNEFFLDKEFLFKVEVETTGWCDSYDVSVIRSDSTNLSRWRDTQGPVKSGVSRAGPINPVHPRGEDGCSVCDESPDPIVENLSVTKRPVVRRLLDEFNMSGAPSIKK
ncbi:uncharacterized protein DS421_8g231090 [Arachis hypogaea]|nr:uncharacterized protein DS421_8g231090 [Arachis hypogaea]